MTGSEQTFAVSWEVDGTRVSSAYSLETLTRPHNGCGSRLEWLLRSLAADGCHHITMSLPIPQDDVLGVGWQE